MLRLEHVQAVPQGRTAGLQSGPLTGLSLPSAPPPFPGDPVGQAAVRSEVTPPPAPFLE